MSWSRFFELPVRRLSTPAVAGAATRAALADHGIARWRALGTNLASRAVADRLGFSVYGANLTVRLRTAGAVPD